MSEVSSFPSSMRAVVLTGIRKLEVRELPVPQIKNAEDVLLKVERVGICGSDIHYYASGRIGSQVVQYPYTVGHECAATVVQVGAEVTNVKLGDRVAVEPAIPCFDCDQCRAGRENTCRNMLFLGCPGQVEGCMCEYIVMPSFCCIPIPPQVTFEEAVICEPMAVGLYALRLANLPAGSRIAVTGSGPIGLSVLLSARAMGIEQVMATDKVPLRVKMAGTAGASWTGSDQNLEDMLTSDSPEVDAVFECSGDQDAVEQGVRLLTPGGKLILVGIPSDSRFSFSMDQLRRRELSVLNVRRQLNCTESCVQMIASGEVDVKFMATHSFDVHDAGKAFDMVAARDEVVKATITF